VPQPPGPRILVVDDDDAQTALIKRFLDRHGYQVTCSNSPVMALELLQEQADFKLVITDLMMPHSDGISFTQALHELEHYKNLPVVLITAYPSDEMIEKGMRKGVALTLQKPLELSKLLDLVGFATH
jgi:two-component system, chemotaxis family, chemotaxis protein CheY